MFQYDQEQVSQPTKLDCLIPKTFITSKQGLLSTEIDTAEMTAYQGLLNSHFGDYLNG